VISISNHKGGIAKTTSALTLGAALAEMSFNVCLAGLDTQRHLIESAEKLRAHYPNLHIINITPGTIRSAAKKAQKSGFQFFIIDCPPDVEKGVPTALKISDMVLVPMQTNKLSFIGMEEISRMIDAARDPARGGNTKLVTKYLATMFHKNEPDSVYYLDKLQQSLGPQMSARVINQDVRFWQAANRDVTILEHVPRSAGANAYRALAKEVVDALKN
jgi:chromosome partitioning protein